VRRIELPHGGYVEHEPAWLPPDQATEILCALGRELRWEARAIWLFGRRILQTRLVAWAGERPYRYSGQTLEPRPFSPTLLRVLERIEARTGERMNHVLANRYRSGEDRMGMHADDEPELGPNPVVLSVSLGATRRFVLRAKRGGKDALRFALALGHGDLLLMGGSCQHHFRHGVPAVKAAGERISLTCRRLLDVPCAPPEGAREP
jgi:alkylated DNA repair dioxygenase AlkB